MDEAVAKAFVHDEDDDNDVGVNTVGCNVIDSFFDSRLEDCVEAGGAVVATDELDWDVPDFLPLFLFFFFFLAFSCFVIIVVDDDDTYGVFVVQIIKDRIERG